MKSRWVRQAIHAELDSVREHYATLDDGLPLDLEVDSVMGTHRPQPHQHDHIHYSSHQCTCVSCTHSHMSVSQFHVTTYSLSSLLWIYMNSTITLISLTCINCFPHSLASFQVPCFKDSDASMYAISGHGSAWCSGWIPK